MHPHGCVARVIWAILIATMRVHRYTNWDGTQEVLFPTPQDLLKHLSDRFLDEGGVRKALRDLMRRGFTSDDGERSVKGIRDFLREAEEKKKEILQKYSSDWYTDAPSWLRGQSHLGYINRYHEGASVYQLGWNAGGPFSHPARSPQTPFRSFFR